MLQSFGIRLLSWHNGRMYGRTLVFVMVGGALALVLVFQALNQWT